MEKKRTALYYNSKFLIYVYIEKKKTERNCINTITGYLQMVEIMVIIAFVFIFICIF